MAATLKSGGTEPDESEVQMILWRGEATVWVICLSIGRGRGSRDEVEEVELRREILLPLNVYYTAINLSCYYAAVALLLKVYYAIIMLLLILKVYYAAIMLLLL